MKKILLTFTLLNLFIFSINAQVSDTAIDSLKLLIRKAKSDSSRINSKLNLAGKMSLFNLDTAVVIIKDVQKEIEKLDKNSAFFKKTKATILRSLVNAETSREHFGNALEYQLQAIQYDIEINDSINLGRSYYNLSTIYRRLKDLSKAEKYTRLALKIQENQGQPNYFGDSNKRLGEIYFMKGKIDSAIIMHNRAKTFYTSKDKLISVESNLATIYKSQKKYDTVLEINKKVLALQDPKDHIEMGISYGNLAHTYGVLEDWENALKTVDSCIYYYKLTKRKQSLADAYKFKAQYLFNAEKYKEAYTYQALHKIYSDSVNDIGEQKRITKLELNYEFDKERELTAVELKNESAKKKLYFILFALAIVASASLIFFIHKSSKQRLKLAQNKIELQQVEKLKSDLALANRENELKKVVLENSITEEVLNKTLDNIKEVIKLSDTKERQRELKSISASLLSKKATQKPISSLKEYIDTIAMDFKVHLDTKYPDFKDKEKELLYLMKAGLSTSEISKVSNTSVSAVKSARYRIRRKLDLDSNADIIAHLESTMSTS